MKTRWSTKTVGRRVGWAALLLAAIYWIALLSSSSWSDSALHRVPRLDEAANLEAAAALRGGEWLPPEGYLQPPGMRWLLAPLSGARIPASDFALSDALPLRLRLAQVGAWLGAVTLLLWGARRAAWPSVAGALLAFSPLAAMAALRPLPEIWILFLCSAHLLALRRGQTLLEGALIGLGVLFRGTLVVLLLPSAWSNRRRPRELLRLAVSFALVLLPAVLAQSVHLGRPAGPSLNSGINLYIGNGAEANGFFRSGGSYNFARDPMGKTWLRELGESAEGDALDVDRSWRRRALADMTESPQRSAGLILHKLRFLLVWSELPQISSWEAYLRALPPLRIFALPFGLLVALACAGLPALRERSELRPVAASLLLLLLVHALFFVAGRFRVAMLPALCVLAGHGVILLWNRRRVAWAIAVIAVLLLQPWGMGGLERSLRSGSLLEEGERHRLWAMHLGIDQEIGRVELQRAELRMDEALELTPGRAEIYRAQARVAYLREGRDAAIEILRDGLQAGADRMSLLADLDRLGADAD